MVQGPSFESSFHLKCLMLSSQVFLISGDESNIGNFDLVGVICVTAQVLDTVLKIPSIPYGGCGNSIKSVNN